MKPDATRQRILSAALEIIGHEGVQRVTIRRIASMAKVNVASLNYHFRSKEALVDEAIQSFFGEISSLFQGLLESGIPVEERLTRFFLAYTDNVIAYPGIFISQINFMIESILHKKKAGKEKDNTLRLAGFKELVQNGIINLRNIIREYTGISNERLLSMKVLQMMTSIAHPILLTDIPRTIIGIDFRDREERLVYILSIIRSTQFV